MRFHRIALFAGMLTAAWGNDAGREHLIVRVYNRSEAPDATLREAIPTAQAIFKGAGIEMQWVTCSGWGARESCDPPAVKGKIGHPNLVILLPRPFQGVRKYRALGVAPLAAGSRMGDLAYVFYDRVENAACGTMEFRNLPKVLCGTLGAVRELLAHVMVHETAHLLGLPHSSSGMMRAGWDDGDVQQERNRMWLFSESDAAQLRAAIAARLANDATQLERVK